MGIQRYLIVSLGNPRHNRLQLEMDKNPHCWSSVRFEFGSIPISNYNSSWLIPVVITCERFSVRYKQVAWQAPSSTRTGRLKPGRRTPQRSVSVLGRQRRPLETRSPPDRRLVRPDRAVNGVGRSTASCSDDAADAASLVSWQPPVECPATVIPGNSKQQPWFFSYESRTVAAL